MSVRRQAADARSDARCRVVLGLLLALAAVLRLCASFTLGARTELHGDEWQYVRAAYAILCGGGYPGTLRPPVFPALLAFGFAAGGDTLFAAQLVQMLVGVGTVALTYALARPRFGCRAALVSAAFVALDPTLVNYTHYLWSETLCAFLLAALVLALDRFDLTRRERWLVVAGVALGAGALTREVLLYVLPVIVLWLLGTRADLRTRCRQLALLLAPVVLIVGSWTARNVFTQGHFVLVSTARWAPIAEGLLLEQQPGRLVSKATSDFRAQLAQRHDDVERETYARGVALEAMRRIPPERVMSRLWAGPRALFSIDNQTIRFLRQRWFPAAYAGAARVVARIEVVYYVVAMLLAVLGLWLVPGGRTKTLIVGILLTFVVIHTIAVSTNRYRVPLLPLLTLYVGPLLGGAGRRQRGARWRPLGAALTVAVFLTIVVQTYQLAEVGRTLFVSMRAEAASSPRQVRRALRVARRASLRQELGCAAQRRRAAPPERTRD